MPTFREDIKLGTKVPLIKKDDINDQAITKDKIRDGNVTTEKLADGAVKSDKISDASITTPKIANGNITEDKLDKSAVTTSKIADHSVTSEKIADQSVNNAKLSPSAVTYDKIKDSAVITEKLNDRAVTTEKVEEKAITNPKLGDQAVDGRVIREASVETKHITNDSVTADKLAEKSVTSSKLADQSIDGSKLADGSVGNQTLADDAVTKEKIKDGSITNEKLADGTLKIDKLDPELRKTIESATGLPENLTQMIQDIDETLKEINDTDEKQQSQIEGNTKDIESLKGKSDQLEQSIKDISVSGGASTANAVSYNNETSSLDAINAQTAIDELASKKFDKENIAQELGDSDEKVVSQSALPFRVEESEEWAYLIKDAEDHILLGIQQDGSVEWSAGIPAPIRAKLSEIISQTQQDKEDLSTKIDEINTLLQASIDAKVGKEEGKSLIDDDVKNCFELIENDEWIHAMVDAENHLLFGIRRDTGKPYFPLNEMYHVEQNEEYFALWLDAEDHILMGIRRDGQVVGEIHAVTALKEVVSSLQSDVDNLKETVSTIDNSLQELLNVFSIQDNPEFMAVETDAEGRTLASTNADGSHYSYNLKSETIPEEFSHIDDLEERMSIETDVEGKIMAYRDKDGVKHEHKIEVGVLSAGTLNLSETGMSFFELKLKQHGFGNGTGDWSDYASIHIPEPYCAYANIIGELPTTKGNTTKGKIEFYDMQGNFFKKYVEIDIHGRTSAGFNKKNYTLDFYNDSDYSDSFNIKFGNWVSLDSYYFQGWYTDSFRGIDIVAYKLYQQMIGTRGYLKDKPFKYVTYKDAVSSGTEQSKNVAENLGKNALCTPDGFPVILYLNGEFWGVYTVMLKKNRVNYLMDKKDYSSIELDLGNGNIIKGIKDWTGFEIRNPKTLICMDGSKYDGDNPKELIDESSEKYSSSNKDMKNTLATKNAIEGLMDAFNKIVSAVQENKSNEEIKVIIEKHYNVDYMIDYMIFSNLIENLDGWGGNWQWTTWDGTVWNPNPYDLNATFGLDPYGLFAKYPSSGFESPSVTKYIYDYYKEEIKNRYSLLRSKNVISTSNILQLFDDWIKRIGSENFEEEFKKWNATPSQRSANLNSEFWVRTNNGINSYFYPYSASNTYKKDDYCFDPIGKIYFSLIDSNKGNALSNSEAWECRTFDEKKNYEIGDKCYMCNNICFEFKCLKECTGVPPLSSLYNERYGILGFYDSISRIYKWVDERIQNLDKVLDYSI